MAVIPDFAKAIWNRFYFAFLFVGKILIFALIYWCVFLIRPDAFNFTGGYNSNPLTAFVQDFYGTDDPNSFAVGDSNDALSVFTRAAAELQRKYEAVKDAEAAADEAEKAHDDHLKAQMERIDKGIEEYENKYMVPLKRRIAELEAIIDDPSTQPVASIPLIEEKKMLLEELVKHIDHTLYGRVSFLSDEDASIEAELAKARSEANEAALAADMKYREQRGKLSDVFLQTRDEITGKIGFLDFLYFSACVSTTTTFGDVTANQQWLRLIVVLQILLGIVILSFALSRITNSRA